MSYQIRSLRDILDLIDSEPRVSPEHLKSIFEALPQPMFIDSGKPKSEIKEELKGFIEKHGADISGNSVLPIFFD